MTKVKHSAREQMIVTPPDPTMHEVEARLDVRIPTADPAVTLGADLYLPVGAGPVPLLLMALPYRKDLGGSDLLHRYFARRGYASMILDLQGTGSSDGDPRAPFASEDVQDALDAIAWGSQQDWCTGSVGMWGHSYGGLMTMRTASRRPQALKAIIPVQGLIDPEVDFVHPDHARGLFGPPSWVTGMVTNLVVPPLRAPDDQEALDRWRARLDRADEHVLDLFRHAPGDPAWRNRAVDVSLIDVPALCWLGWRDLFADAQARAFEAMTGPKRLVAGPWMHILPVVSEQGPLDFLGMCLSWWDHWLKGVDNGADQEPSAFFVQGPDPYWTALDEWPPRERVIGALGADDAMDDTEADITLSLTSTASASDPTVGALSGLTRIPTAGIGLPADQHDDDLKSTCWTSEPLKQNLVVVGRPKVSFDAPPAGRVVVKLTHVDPAGRSLLITSGAFGEGAPEVGDTLVLDATAYQVPAGHRLRVVLADADFPRLWPCSGEQPSSQVPRTVHLPTLPEYGVRPVELPAQPAYLSALTAALQSGAGATWTVERELLTGGITMTMASSSDTGTVDAGPRIVVSSSTVAAVPRTAPATVTASNDWEIHRPSQPAVSVQVRTTVTDEGLVASARVTTGDDLTFEQTWTTLSAEATGG